MVRGKNRLVVLSLFCAMSFLMYVDRVNLAAAAKHIQQDLFLSNTELGLIFSAFAYTYCIFQIVGGWFVDRIGARKMIIICGITWVIATVAMGFVAGFVSLFLCRLLLGMGEGIALPSQARAITYWFKKEERGFVQGLTHSFSRLGNVVTPPIIALFIAFHSWRMAFFILGAITLIWVVIWIVKFVDNPRDVKGITEKELEGLPVYIRAEAGVKTPTPWGPLLKRMGPTMGVYFCYGWTSWLFFTWLPIFFMNSRNMDLKDSAIFVSGVFISGVIGNTVGGIISDKILKKTGSLIKARRNLIIFSFITALLLLIPVTLSTSLTVMTICISIAFFCLELTIGPIWAVPMDITPKYVGMGSGLMNAGSAVAGIISPIVFGIIIDQTGNWNLPFIGSICLLLVGVFLTFFMRPDKPLVVPEKEYS